MQDLAPALIYPFALVFRTVAPQLMVGAAFTVLLTQAMLGGRLTSTLSIAIASMLIMFQLGLQLDRWRAAGWAGIYMAAVCLDLVLVEHDEGLLEDLVFVTVVAVGLPLIAGAVLRDRREHEHRLTRLNTELHDERRRTADLAARDERARIALEMHDVVAHSVGLMVVQAGAARHVLDRDPEQSRTALLSVEQVGREALHELRRTLGLLRDADDDTATRQPAPGLSEIRTLVERAESTGLSVSVTTSGMPAALSPGLDVTAYRIIQEALTNTVRHARAASIRLTLDWTSTALRIAVEDDGAGPDPLAEPGLGLRGMRERAATYGGSVEAGSCPTGGFRVAVTLPIDEGQGVAG